MKDPTVRELVSGMTYEVISSQKAREIIGNGKGKRGIYVPLIKELIQQMKGLSPYKVVAFGAKGKPEDRKDIPEVTRRNLCYSVTKQLRDRNLPWRITYSSDQKCFLMVHTKVFGGGSHDPTKGERTINATSIPNGHTGDGKGRANGKGQTSGRVMDIKAAVGVGAEKNGVARTGR